MHKILSLALLGVLLVGCGASTDPGTSAESSRFGVTDSIVGRWVGVAGTSSASDTFAITKDSLVAAWSVGSAGTVPQWLGPVRDSKFYGHHGRMGLTNGMTPQDNVTFEYIFSGDTLVVELQATADPNGTVDRTTTYLTHLLVKRR